MNIIRELEPVEKIILPTKYTEYSILHVSYIFLYYMRSVHFYIFKSPIEAQKFTVYEAYSLSY